MLGGIELLWGLLFWKCVIDVRGLSRVTKPYSRKAFGDHIEMHCPFEGDGRIRDINE